MADDLKTYTVKEAATILKMNPVTLRKMIKSNRIQATKINRDYRISEKELTQFINGGNEHE